ncbi:acylphosphatase [Aquibacillus kalidii]|uniref:acylphosphatase n=1 Tax=Aquibacillus kalidii TaxID=2762597 RepID=UPI001646A6E2|nr:acylphosphatase [Aquibacillus kalidii]
MKKRVHLFVSGRVQSVGFRAMTQQLASTLNIKGWVKNLSNGDVEVEAEGTTENLEKFIASIKQGPSRFIKVSNIDMTTYNDIVGYTSFKIKY